MSAPTDVSSETDQAIRTGRVKVAVVGLGWWGTTISRALQGSRNVELVLGVDPDTSSRSAFETAVGVSASATFEAALEREDVEAVVLCSPHFMHAEQIVAAASHGKHVFSEKPFTTSSDEARHALAAVAANGVQVGIGHERRFEPAVQELQALVRDGGLGVPLIFEGNFSQDKFLALPPDNWRLSSKMSPAGPLSATGIHLVDLAISILGRPVEVWARLATLATNFGNGDTLSVTLAFESGASATITAVLTSPFLGRVCVMGSTGWMEIIDRSHPEDSAGWDVRLTRRDHETESRFFPAHGAVLSNLEVFADAVRGVAPYPVSATEIQTNVDTFEAIIRSAKSGRVERV